MAGDANVLGFFISFIPSIQGTNGVEEQLRPVGQSKGIAVDEAFARELFDEIAEEEIHGIGYGEVVNVVGMVGGKGFEIAGGSGVSETVRVVGA